MSVAVVVGVVVACIGASSWLWRTFRDPHRVVASQHYATHSAQMATVRFTNGTTIVLSQASSLPSTAPISFISCSLMSISFSS